MLPPLKTRTCLAVPAPADCSAFLKFFPSRSASAPPGPALWHRGHSHCLQCHYHIWRQVCGLGKVATGGSISRAAATREGTLAAPDLWLLPVAVLAIVDSWGVTQQAEDLCPSFRLCNLTSELNSPLLAKTGSCEFLGNLAFETHSLLPSISLFHMFCWCGSSLIAANMLMSPRS